jgi:coatomer subunit beta
MAAFETKCTFLVGVPERDEGPTKEWILKGLESTNDDDKVDALKRAIVSLVLGDEIPGILMTVIRYCINTDSHELQKLMMLFWEIAEKYDNSGKPLPQLLLIV